MFLFFSIVLAQFFVFSNARVVLVTLTVDQVYVVIQGVEKTIAAFNGTFPGPEIRVNIGDSLNIQVINHLHREIVSVHWHGLMVQNNPYMDGVAYITQCGINPMESFVYSVLPDKVGTFWYHGHVAEDRTDSMFGALIVVPPSYPFLFDAELVWQLSDFYTTYDVQINAGLEARPFRFPGNPYAFPLNGAIAPFISVQPNKTYLIRLINAGALSWHNFTIAGHSMTIVEVQGTYTQPLTVKNIYINNGERVTFLLRTDYPGCWQVRYNMMGPGRAGTGVAHLGYEGSNCNMNNTVFVTPNTDQVWNQSALVSRNDRPFRLPDSNKVINLYSKQVRTGPVASGIKWSINSYTFVHPVTPLIFTYHYFRSTTASSFPVISVEGEIVKRTYIIDINYGDVIDFYFYNQPRSWDGNSEQHPMHFHGHSFWLLGSGSNGTNITLNLVNPIKVDTFTLPAYGWAVVRLVADNPGIWMVHCHIAWHNRMGMAFVLAYPSRTIPSPPENFAVCGEISCKTIDLDDNYWGRYNNRENGHDGNGDDHS